MAIRFQCPACSEPIEVDDEWGRQVVRCPYCQRTVTAPMESTLPASDQIPVATAIAGRREFQVPSDPVGPVGAVPAYAPSAPTNRAAVAALVLVILSIVLSVLASQLLSSHLLEWKELEKILTETAEAKGSPATAMLKYMESQGGSYPGWMVAYSALTMGYLGAWLGAIIFGIVGLFRPVRRGMAITALVMAGMFVALLCLSAISGVAG